MQTRKLGKSDLQITPIIFGAWAIGGWMWGGTDEADSIAAIHASIANGVTTIDTAAIYGMGASEELVAKAIKGKRDKLIIATKCGMRWNTDEGSDPWQTKDNAGKDVVVRKNSKPDSIAYECEQSLKRLGIDVIDLYQIHWPDSSTPVEESIRALEKLRQQGKIRAIGVSNYDAQWLAKGSAVGTIASDQPPYSLIQRKIEKDVLPYCRQHDIGIIAYSPMERGLLTGKVSADREFPPGDHRAGQPFFSVENRKRILASLEKIRPIADRHKATFAQLAINWTAHVPGITAAIVGARNAEQAEQNAKALSFTLTSDEMSQIRRAFDDTSAAMMSSK
jgi:aryl-alcohol dehydrogenase-like predicted oxidoreductase